MSKFSVDLDKTRPSRYVFLAKLWDKRLKNFGDFIPIMLDTGAFNTVISKSLVSRHATMLNGTMPIAIGGYKLVANICIIQRMNINGFTLHKIAALAVPFKGELKDHILLGANVINNWEVTLSRQKHRLSANEDVSAYRHIFNAKGQIMSFQELE
ncbi:MAG: retroviral-like aspartic protease family protein [Turicibacter sp.]|nr:retroviral-like aspartic protease family protein [Turicibacter sp.]